MDNTLIFIISITIAALLFNTFSAMVKKSARAHKEEEKKELRRQAMLNRRQSTPPPSTPTIMRTPGTVTFKIEKTDSESDNNFSTTNLSS